MIQNLTLVLDWSVLAHQNWHKMFSPGYEAESDLELEEYARNLCSHAYELQQRFQPVETIIALDSSPNWRKKVYDDYYEEHIDYYKVLAEDQHWILAYDYNYYRLRKNDTTEKWFYTKIKPADVRELQLADDTEYVKFTGGKTPGWICDTYPDAPRTMRDHPDWAHFDRVIPGYKKKRLNSKWVAATPKKEFKVLTNKLAVNFAPLIGARAIQVPGAEGDDVAAVATCKAAGPVVLVTVDADLKQLKIKKKDFCIWEPVKKIFCTESSSAAMYLLVCKLLGGDTSDDITGVARKKTRPFPSVSWCSDGSVRNGKTTVAWINKQLGIDAEKMNDLPEMAAYTQLFKQIEKETVPEELYRNMRLIFLENIPEDIQSGIRLLLDISDAIEPKYKLDDYGITDRVAKSLEHGAHEQSKTDTPILEGVFGGS